jgi:hypothetical protein
MNFLEDIEMYNKAMTNAYDLITKRKTVDDVYEELYEDYNEYYLPFDPILEDGRTADVIDMVIEHFSSLEEYEKCEELVKIKTTCLRK